jgi:hypothetical protein
MIADSYMSVALWQNNGSQPKEHPMRFAISPRITFAPADSAGASSTVVPVMEVVTFRLTPGITDAAFIVAAKGTEAMVAAQPGFVRRSLLRDDAGEWTDSIEWQSLAQAQTAAEILMANPAFAPFGAAIDMTSLSMRHTPILWQMGD